MANVMICSQYENMIPLIGKKSKILTFEIMGYFRLFQVSKLWLFLALLTCGCGLMVDIRALCMI